MKTGGTTSCRWSSALFITTRLFAERATLLKQPDGRAARADFKTNARGRKVLRRCRSSTFCTVQLPERHMRSVSSGVEAIEACLGAPQMRRQLKAPMAARCSPLISQPYDEVPHVPRSRAGE